MTIGERIAQLLKEQGKLAKDLAKFLGISASSVTGWIHGSYPSSQHIVKICEFLNVTTEFLLTGKEKNPTADFSGISVDGLRVGCLWDGLDEAGRAIILGQIYQRLEALSAADRDPADELLKRAN